MMNGKNLLPAVLVGLLCLSSITAAACALLYVRASGEIRKLQAQVTSVNNNQAAVRSLANDALEYSKRNPAIHPILEAVGARPRNNP
jgi:hypothetical protein